MSMKKGVWHRNAQGKLVRRRGRRPAQPTTVRDEVQVLPVEQVLDERVERVLNGVWKGLSINDKMEAIHSLFFDPSNPNED